MTTKDKIQSSIDKLPKLTDFGIGIFGNRQEKTKDEYQKEFQLAQKQLLNNIEQFEKTCTWLQKIEKIKIINSKNSSYGLKHIAEKEIGYITNGVFIAAAVYSDFNFRVRDDNPNVEFNMSQKSINNLIR